MKNLLLLSLVVCVGTGCVTGGGALSNEAKSKVKNVAVFSGLGEKLQFANVPAVTSKGKYETISVADWGVDALVVTHVINPLKATGRYQKVGQLTSDSHDFNVLLHTAKDQGYDTLIFVGGANYEITSATKPGYGLKHSTPLLASASTRVYLLAQIHIYDTSTGAELGSSWTFNTMGKPWVFAEGEMPWHESFEGYSATEKAQVEKALKAHVATCVDYAIHQLQLL